MREQSEVRNKIEKIKPRVGKETGNNIVLPKIWQSRARDIKFRKRPLAMLEHVFSSSTFSQKELSV